MSRQALYLECYSGISGDMLLGAMLDLGISCDYLEKELAKLPLEGYKIRVGRTEKCGVAAMDFDVIVEEEAAHTHTHPHSHSHRTYRDIRRMIEESMLSKEVQKRALKVFEILAEAEGKVHQKPMDQVGFHEVGAVDSIVDIVGAAICMEKLAITEIFLSPMYEGRGHCLCQHGKIPVPVPAVLELTIRYGLPLKITETQGEMITPTGAAIAAAFWSKEQDMSPYRMCGVGIGAGKKEFPHANILRAVLLKSAQEESAEVREQVWVLETNIDDLSGEGGGHAVSLLMAAGALDASCYPCLMKKGRPGYMLQVICKEEQLEELEAVIFRETTSIGLRKYQEERHVLSRKQKVIEVFGYGVHMKVCKHKEETFCYPEYEDIQVICQKTNKSFREVYHEAAKKAGEA